MVRYALNIVPVIVTVLAGTTLPDSTHAITGLNGYPFITNIAPDEYDSHIQNWGFAADSNGVLYVANQAGVMRYDGVTWHHISVPNTHALSITNSDDGRVYVGGSGELGYIAGPDMAESGPSETDIAGSFGGGSVTHGYRYQSLRHLIPDTVAFDNVWHVIAVEDAVVYMSNSHLFRYDGETLSVYPAETRFSGLIEMDGEVYTRVSERGIKRVDADGLTHWPDGDFFSDRTLQSYLKTGNRQYFCSFYTCFHYEEGTFRPMESEADDYLESNYIDEVIALSDSTIAIGTRNGGVVHMTDDGRLLRILDEENGLISNTVLGLYEDRQQSLWVATINGISRVDNGLPFQRFDHRNGLNEPLSRMLIHRDTMYISSSNGIYRMDNSGGVRFFDRVESCSRLIEHRDRVYAVCAGNLHFVGRDSLLQISPSGFANVMGRYDDDTLIAAYVTEINLIRLEGSEYEVIYSMDGPGVRPASVAADTSGSIWVGTTSSGLFRIALDVEAGGDTINGHTVSRYLRHLENPGDNPRVHVTVLDGAPAFLTWGEGMLRHDPDSDTFNIITRYGEKLSDSERQYFLAVEDHRGNVWFRSDESYQVARLREDGEYEIESAVFRRLDDRQTNAIYPDRNGYVWYVTERGLVRYDTSHDFDVALDFHTEVDEVIARGDSLIARGFELRSPVLDYSDNNLRFTYAAASYHAPEQTEYRVKLEGFDAEWSSWTREVQRDYTNIPEGSYRFLVEARNVYGVISAADPFLFTVLPPWYRTWWAYLFYLLTATGILYTAYRIRVNQILRVQRIRNRIAGDLHDEVSATLSSISFFARAIKEDRYRGDKNRFVELISQSAGEAKEKISDIVWAINPEHDDWKSFLSKCRRYASDLLESRNIRYQLNIDENMPGKLDMQLRQHLWMIFKEMITNVARHSEAVQVEVTLKQSGGMLILVVQDDGKGFDSGATTAGHGVANIRQRAESIGAHVTLETGPGMGTRWKLTLKKPVRVWAHAGN